MFLFSCLGAKLNEQSISRVCPDAKRNRGTLANAQDRRHRDPGRRVPESWSRRLAGCCLLELPGTLAHGGAIGSYVLMANVGMHTRTTPYDPLRKYESKSVRTPRPRTQDPLTLKRILKSCRDRPALPRGAHLLYPAPYEGWAKTCSNCSGTSSRRTRCWWTVVGAPPAPT